MRLLHRVGRTQERTLNRFGSQWSQDSWTENTGTPWAGRKSTASSLGFRHRDRSPPADTRDALLGLDGGETSSETLSRQATGSSLVGPLGTPPTPVTGPPRPLDVPRAPVHSMLPQRPVPPSTTQGRRPQERRPSTEGPHKESGELVVFGHVEPLKNFSISIDDS